MRIYVTNIFVDDQEKAKTFYCDVLGFKVSKDIPVGEYRWLTVVSDEDPDGTELLLEPSTHCLLYTSPSPRDLSTSRMPSSA